MRDLAVKQLEWCFVTLTVLRIPAWQTERTPLTSPQSTSEIANDDFVRRFAMRTGNIMWFLGAGASASSGIATAGDMIWEFKQRLFVTQQRTSPRAVADLSDPNVRLKLQNFIDSLADAPAQGGADEYATLFEMVYPAE